jgi:hypothetical protein
MVSDCKAVRSELSKTQLAPGADALEKATSKNSSTACSEDDGIVDTSADDVPSVFVAIVDEDP